MPLRAELVDDGSTFYSFNLKEKDRDRNFVCPVCGNEMIPVLPEEAIIKHFRHKEGEAHGEPESKTHLEAKKYFFNKLKEDNYFDSAEIEREIGDQLADLFFIKDGKKIAIEIQCSIQGKKKFRERTEKYNSKGIYVLWILYESFFPEKESTDMSIIGKNKIVSGTKFRKSVRWLQSNLYFGRTYSFVTTDYLEDRKFMLMPVRLTSKSVMKEGFNPRERRDFTYEYYYRTIGNLTTGDIPNYGLLTTKSNKYKIARFYDKCWWKDDK